MPLQRDRVPALRVPSVIVHGGAGADPAEGRAMAATRHILLVGDGALAFARTQGLPECDPQSLVTERQLVRHHERLAAMQGTVGAVALDTNGTIAAATSTGGLAGKLPGRVGDSALIRSEERRVGKECRCGWGPAQ